MGDRVCRNCQAELSGRQIGLQDAVDVRCGLHIACGSTPAGSVDCPTLMVLYVNRPRKRVSDGLLGWTDQRGVGGWPGA